MAKYIGAHTIDNGGIQMTVLRAANAGMTALQLFTAIPKFYGDKSNIKPERVERFKSALVKTKIKPANVVVHAAYVLSVATPEDDKWVRASAGLTKEMERSSTLGVGCVCFHPGSAGASDRSDSAKRIGKAITVALKTVESDTRLLVENTAGAGKTMGRTAQEIKEILDAVPKQLRSRTGYGLDTCHLFASGYDITASRQAFTDVLDEFEQIIGEPPSFFHLNDSANELGSNRDRHVLIGEGHIGKAPFEWLMQDRRSSNIPLILETPQENYDIADDDPSPDPYDVKMFKMLEAWA
ncbi:MAG TPA: deoxyribonuclease IV [Gemmatimonadaceae bacterium]|jgi:deoxyribonuclease IV|nr:deoxyribonuclease IV [Gemmatimonadaceae bacterium]